MFSTAMSCISAFVGEQISSDRLYYTSIKNRRHDSCSVLKSHRLSRSKKFILWLATRLMYQVHDNGVIQKCLYVAQI